MWPKVFWAAAYWHDDYWPDEAPVAPAGGTTVAAGKPRLPRAAYVRQLVLAEWERALAADARRRQARRALEREAAGATAEEAGRRAAQAAEVARRQGLLASATYALVLAEV